MAHKITLEQAAEKAHQLEIICAMWESYPDNMAESEISALTSLLKKLTGDVTCWLIEEQALREGR